VLADKDKVTALLPQDNTYATLAAFAADYNVRGGGAGGVRGGIWGGVCCGVGWGCVPATRLLLGDVHAPTCAVTAWRLWLIEADFQYCALLPTPPPQVCGPVPASFLY
jgi:hypothetical protein